MKIKQLILLFFLCSVAFGISSSEKRSVSILWDIINTNGDSELQFSEIQNYLTDDGTSEDDFDEVTFTSDLYPFIY